MCGIAGISFEPEAGNKVNKGIHLFKDLLEENTKRGKHSTGITYVSDNNYEVMRGFATGDIVRHFIQPSVKDCGVFGHLRFATIGDKFDIDNVHPFITEKYVGVHNGSIFNYKFIKEAFGLECISDCDSEVIYRLFDVAGVEAAKHLYGTYMLTFIEKSNPGHICILTNGSKPLLGLKGDGFLAFGSIGEKAFSNFLGLKETDTMKLLSPQPGVLYKIHNGSVVEKTTINGINPLTEEEGELRYKLEFKNLYRDHFNQAIPVSRRLPAPKVETTKVIGFQQTKNVERTTPIEIKSCIDYLDKLSSVTNFIGSEADSLPEGVMVHTKSFFYQAYQQNTNYVLDCYKKIVPYRFQNGTYMYYRNLYALEKFIMYASLFRTVQLYDESTSLPLTEQWMLKSPALFIASIFINPESKYHTKLCKIVQEKLVDTGIIAPEIEMVAYNSLTKDVAEKKNYILQKGIMYDLCVFAGKKQAGNHYTTLNEYVDHCKDVSFSSTDKQNSYLSLQRLLLLALLTIKNVEVESFLHNVFVDKGEYNLKKEEDSLLDIAMDMAQSERDKSTFIESLIKESPTDKKNLLYLGLISTQYPKILFGWNNNENKDILIPNGNDLFATAFEDKIYNNTVYPVSDLTRFTVAAKIISFISSINFATRGLVKEMPNGGHFSLRKSSGETLSWEEILVDVAKTNQEVS